MEKKIEDDDETEIQDYKVICTNQTFTWGEEDNRRTKEILRYFSFSVHFNFCFYNILTLPPNNLEKYGLETAFIIWT